MNTARSTHWHECWPTLGSPFDTGMRHLSDLNLLTRSAKQRREAILSHFGATKPKVLEIGAFDNATFYRELGDDVAYVDFFSTDELKEMHKNNQSRRFHALVEIDYVVKSNHFAVEIDAKFDLIVANHVVEHIPDTIYWLRQLQSLLTENGMIFLAVPDRRYTFDYFREVSTATQMMRAHSEKLDKPDYWQVLDHFYYHQKVDLKQLWAGTLPERFVPRFSLEKAMQMAEVKSKEYVDAHCWVFTDESFADCIRDLQSAAMLDLEIHDIQPPQVNSNEFQVLLKTKTPTPAT